MKLDGNIRYIDVLGQAEYENSASEYKITLSLKFKTGLSRLEKSGAVIRAETKRAFNLLVDTLVKNGIADEQIKFAGAADLKTWRRKGFDEYRSNKFVIRHEDLNKIIQVPMWLDTIDLGKHHVEYSAFQPIYNENSDARERAFASAMKNAIQIASAIAEAAGQSIGEVIHVQDRVLSNQSQRNMDWMSAGVAAGSAGNEITDYNFEDHVKLIKVELKVRFKLI